MKQPIVSIQQLRLKFPGKDSMLFRDFSLSIYPGEKVLLLGPSGCGKSTLLQVCTGIVPNLIEIPLKYDEIIIPAVWGYLFQDPDTQFCMPYVDEELAFVLENLQVPRKQMPIMIRDYLAKVGLHLDELHTEIHTLSQGMKQRLAIASILALEPDVLFLDEPTSLLDPEGTRQVWETIKEVGKAKTVLIVEHKIDQIVDFVDRVIVLNDQGELIADGLKAEVFMRHKKQLLDYGIWYPGVWHDYVESADFKQLKLLDIKQRNCFSESSKSLIELEAWSGRRGKQTKIEVLQVTVAQAEWITVVGENGAGKSTLLLALMQLIPTSGTYLLAGTPASEIDDLSCRLAFVFQNPELQFVTNSVYDEVAYSLRLDQMGEQDVVIKVNQLLALFSLTKQQEQHPYQLSLGQKRRLSVAAAIVKEQQILMLDEPTFGQDAKNTFVMLEKLEMWRKQGTTIIMVTHDLDIVQHFATRVWTLKQGKLVSDQKGG